MEKMKFCKKQGLMIWITGISGAGKTTLAEAVIDKLKSTTNSVIHLDGDELRAALCHFEEFSQNNNYSEKARRAYALSYTKIASMLVSQGHIVVVSTISLIKEVHEYNRLNFSNYFEIYIEVDLSTAVLANSKQLYSNSHNMMVGREINADIPEKPDMVIKDPYDWPPDRIAEKVIRNIREKFKRRDII